MNMPIQNLFLSPHNSVAICGHEQALSSEKIELLGPSIPS